MRRMVAGVPASRSNMALLWVLEMIQGKTLKKTVEEFYEGKKNCQIIFFLDAFDELNDKNE